MAHKAKALVLSCIDFRFQKMIEDFISIDQNCIKNYDHIAIAGAVKQLVDPSKPAYREYLLEQIGLSINLHDPDTIYLINHADCGAYGINNSNQTHENDLKKAASIIREKYPNVKIRTYIAGFNGLEEVIEKIDNSEEPHKDKTKKKENIFIKNNIAA